MNPYPPDALAIAVEAARLIHASRIAGYSDILSVVDDTVCDIAMEVEWWHKPVLFLGASAIPLPGYLAIAPALTLATVGLTWSAPS